MCVCVCSCVRACVYMGASLCGCVHTSLLNHLPFCIARPKTKLLIVDHISSGYAFITPLKVSILSSKSDLPLNMLSTCEVCVCCAVQEVVEVCHSRGIMVLVDGAHALGSIPLNLKYVGMCECNCIEYTWLNSSPYSSSLLCFCSRKIYVFA